MERMEPAADLVGDIAKKLQLGNNPEAPCPAVLTTFDLSVVAKHIKTNKCKNIIVMAVNGISVTSGIQDFCTPCTGLYDNLSKYNSPKPTAVFDIDFFKETPSMFYQLTKEIFPGQYQPTPKHNFIRLLHNHLTAAVLLHAEYGLARSTQASIPKDKIVDTHENFDSATCIDTGTKVPIDEVLKAIMSVWARLLEEDE